MLRESLVYSLEKLIKVFSRFILSIWIIRLLGPTQFGKYSLAFTIVISVFSISSMGVETLLTRDIKCLAHKRGLIIYTSFILRLIITLILAFLLIAYFSFINYDPEFFLLIFLISISQIFNTFIIIESFFLALKKSFPIAIISLISNSINIIIKLFILRYYSNAVSLSCCLIVEHLIYSAGLLSYLILYFKKEKINIKFSFRYARILLSKAKLLTLALPFSAINIRAEILVLGFFYDSSVIGIYSAAQKIIQACYLIPSSVLNVYYPNILKGLGKVNSNYLKKLSLNISIFSLIISLFIFASRGMIVEILLGEDYKNSSAILSVLSWSLILVTALLIRKKYLITTNQQSLVLFYSFTNSIFMIPTLILSTHIFGILGTAWGYLLTLSISLFIVPSFIKSKKWYLFQ